ncbi:MAG: hypothetical protein JNM93_02255, partial [Bacteriovoracaceae bacterium]|nr:hypothetical protein [Bacteriovoracaceae bacterium]
MKKILCFSFALLLTTQTLLAQTLSMPPGMASNTNSTLGHFVGFKTATITIPAVDNIPEVNITVEYINTIIENEAQDEIAYRELAKFVDETNKLGGSHRHLQINPEEAVRNLYDIKVIDDSHLMNKYHVNSTGTDVYELSQEFYSKFLGGRTAAQTESALTPEEKHKNFIQKWWKNFLTNDKTRRKSLGYIRLFFNGSILSFSLSSQGFMAESAIIFGFATGLISATLSWKSDIVTDYFSNDKYYKAPKNYLIKKLNGLGNYFEKAAVKVEDKTNLISKTLTSLAKPLQKMKATDEILTHGKLPMYGKWWVLGFAFISAVQIITVTMNQFDPMFSSMLMGLNGIFWAANWELISQGLWETAAVEASKVDEKKVLKASKDAKALTTSEVE